MESDLELLYRKPINIKAFSPEDLSIFLQDNLLGVFESKDNDSIFGSESETGSYTERLESVTSLGGHSLDTYISHRSNLSHRTTNTISGACPSVNEEVDSVAELHFNMWPQTTATFWTKTNIKHFEGSHLKTFFSALFTGGSMWICGWNKNKISSSDTVLVNVKIPQYKSVTKHKMANRQAHQQTIMLPFGEPILFAKKGGSKIFNCNTYSFTFKVVLSHSKLAISALCGTGNHIYILDNARPQDIQIFDSSLQPEGKIPTGLENVKDCDVDMCLINDQDRKYGSMFHSSRASQLQKAASASQSSDHVDKIMVICTSIPCASVRAISQTHGLICELNYRTIRQIGIWFDPCSVTASESGDVFIADRGTNKVSD